MSYPSLPLLKSSEAAREGGFEAVRASNGVLRVRRLYSAEKMAFNLRHVLTDAERTTLETAYGTYKTANLTFTWPVDGLTYTVRFAQAPQYTKDGPWWRASVTLLEV